MLPASPGPTPGRARRRPRRGWGRSAPLSEGGPRPLQARLGERRRRGCSVQSPRGPSFAGRELQPESAPSPSEGPEKGEGKRSARNTPFLLLFLPLSLFLRLSGSVSFSSPFSSSSSFSSSPRSFSFSSSSPSSCSTTSFFVPFFLSNGASARRPLPLRARARQPPPQAAGPLPAGIYNPALGERARSPWKRLPREQGGQAQTSHNQWINASPAPLQTKQHRALAGPLSQRRERGAWVHPHARTRGELCDAGLHAHLQEKTKRVKGVGEVRADRIAWALRRAPCPSRTRRTPPNRTSKNRVVPTATAGRVTPPPNSSHTRKTQSPS